MIKLNDLLRQQICMYFICFIIVNRTMLFIHLNKKQQRKNRLSRNFYMIYVHLWGKFSFISSSLGYFTDFDIKELSNWSALTMQIGVAVPSNGQAHIYYLGKQIRSSQCPKYPGLLCSSGFRLSNRSSPVKFVM